MREEAGSGPHWPHGLGSLGVQLAVSSFVFLYARAAGLAADLDCIAPAAQVIAWVGVLMWRRGAGGLTVHLWAPASGGEGVHVGRVLHPLLGWGTWQLGRGSFSFCLLSVYFLSLAPQTCGLTWDCTQPCRSLSESSGLRATGLMPQGLKELPEDGCGLPALCTCASAPTRWQKPTAHSQHGDAWLSRRPRAADWLIAAVLFLWMCGRSAD